MALCTDAAMVLYYDIDGDHADHDEWHTYEHMHERLSVPGFVRATRWVAVAGGPRYMVIYEVAGTEMAASPDYLARLNAPTPWTAAMMGRFRAMTRGFCEVVAGSGFGFGNAALSLRFTPADGAAPALLDTLSREVLPAIAARRGMAGVHLLRPAAAAPMTTEQSLRGPDAPMRWLLLASAYDRDALARTIADQLGADAFARMGAAPGIEAGSYALHYTATAQEVTRTAPHPPLPPDTLPRPG